ncbi:MAG: polynucleotide kinase-phosphatase [Deltaproteobacteria bacterium]|nr:polynucleotide kinase-phosphatase [Deltaproteobacteria bacterium]
MSVLTIPEKSLVVLVGASGSGKSTFAAKHFLPTEVVSSDVCRGLVSDDTNDQAATPDAFEVVHAIASARLRQHRLTVIDATNVQKSARQPLIQLARKHHVLPVAIVLDVPAKVCHARNENRPDRQFGSHVVAHQRAQLRKSLRRLKKEGFRRVHVLDSAQAIEDATFERQKLWNDRKDDHGPFDVIGDVHGCASELVTLLTRLGYERSGEGYVHPHGRRVIFVGDLVDRGPDSPGVLAVAMAMVASGQALCVMGNHEAKLLKKLAGKKVKLTHGLAETWAQLEVAREARGDAFLDQVRAFLDARISHYVLDDGKLVVAHAGLAEHLQGRASGRVRSFALYGETTGETDEFGFPVRHDWARDYRGKAVVVYGHTPVPDAEWVNDTICIDTGCVFGGALTALRWPERELVSVPAEREHYAPRKPLVPEAQLRPAGVLDVDDVIGKRHVQTRLARTVTVREENGAAALEVMSRFAVDPRWLIHLPPTMAPVATSARDGFLEHPAEAFDYFRSHGVSRVICEEKHMGSRAVLVVCRDADAARARFGVTDGKRGVVVSRTGRAFFADDTTEAEVLERVAQAVGAAGLWEELGSDWVCLDAELMPWSAKAMALLRSQYAPVAAASRLGLSAATDALARCEHADARALLERFQERLTHTERYTEAYRRYCWPVASTDDLKLAPFHLLASEGAVHTDRDHGWHMATLARLAEHDSLLMATTHRVVDVGDPSSVDDTTEWWLSMVEAGGEGMVVKPFEWLAHGEHGVIQPALKVRGPEYLRIIYGPEYSATLARLRDRRLGTKRKLAVRELALGLEALHRFVEKEPLYRVHECVFGVLALESEPVDPRL